MNVTFHLTGRSPDSERKMRRAVGGRRRCALDPETGKLHSMICPIGQALNRRHKQIWAWYYDAMKWRSQQEQFASFRGSGSYTTDSGGSVPFFTTGFTLDGVEFVRKTPIDEPPK